MLLSFKITDMEFMEWVLTIIRLKPNVTLEVIRKITDNFLTGVSDFDKEQGILNYTKKIDRYLGRNF